MMQLKLETVLKSILCLILGDWLDSMMEQSIIYIHDHGVKNHNSNTLGTIGYLQDWNHAQNHYPN